MSGYLLTVWLCKISNQTLLSKILWIYVLQMTKCHIRPIKHNPEWNATIIITRFFSIFLTASRIISPPPCCCLLLFYHNSNARKKKTYKQYAHCPLKPFSSFFSGAIYIICIRFQCILSSQHKLDTSLSKEKQQKISKSFLWGSCVILSRL